MNKKKEGKEESVVDGLITRMKNEHVGRAECLMVKDVKEDTIIISIDWYFTDGQCKYYEMAIENSKIEWISWRKVPRVKIL